MECWLDVEITDLIVEVGHVERFVHGVAGCGVGSLELEYSTRGE